MASMCPSGWNSPSSCSIFSGCHVSETPSSSSSYSPSSSSDSEGDSEINGLKGTQSSSTSKIPTLYNTPLTVMLTSSLSFFLIAVRMQILACDTSMLFQKEL
ncbi:hypothetical protein LXL04_002369 [Taraxacum kok-saghyz]